MAVEYVALFRNMNLGHAGSPVRAVLEAAFLASGADTARSFQTNGTVVFETRAPGREVTAGAIRQMGFADVGFTWRLDAVADLVADDPFRTFHRSDTYRECVTFFADNVDGARFPEVDLVMTSPLMDIVAVRPGVALSLIRRSPAGAVGSPMRLVETALGAPATTRTFGTISRLVARQVG